MSRSLITFFFTYVLIHLFYGISGFDPLRAFPKLPGYLLDLGIWLPVYLFIFWALGVLGIGKARNRKTAGAQD
jgi:hypothetical protein